MGIVTRCEYVAVVAHPWCGGHKYAARGLIEAWHFDLIPEHYLREFVDAAQSCGKAIEVNHKALADADATRFQTYLQMLREFQVPVAIGSDAHAIDSLGRTTAVDRILKDVGFSPAQIWTPARN
jgi:histidinol phosphatase-like PHP family hydrolase